MANNQNKNTTISCLQHAIEDAQATIRAYDSKAEVLGILLTLAIGITNLIFLEQPDRCSKLLLGASVFVGLMAAGLLGVVLNPKKDLFSKISFGGYAPKGTYFVANIGSGPQNTVSALSEEALDTNWTCELMFESMKLSLIREHKHRWFIRALWCSGGQVVLIASAVLVVGARKWI